MSYTSYIYLAVNRSFKKGFKTGDSQRLHSMLREALFLSLDSTVDAKLPRGDMDPAKKQVYLQGIF